MHIWIKVWSHVQEIAEENPENEKWAQSKEATRAGEDCNFEVNSAEGRRRMWSGRYVMATATKTTHVTKQRCECWGDVRGLGELDNWQECQFSRIFGAIGLQLQVIRKWRGDRWRTGDTSDPWSKKSWLVMEVFRKSRRLQDAEIMKVQ